ncbi:hypothetical protein D3C80_1982480 [compost metagenome]
MDHIHPTTNAISARRLLLGSAGRSLHGTMHLFHRLLHTVLQALAVTQRVQAFHGALARLGYR